MIRKIRKPILMIIVAFLPIVIIPQFFDPLGVRYLDDVYDLTVRLECANDACTRIRLPEGRLKLNNRWSITSEADGRRLVPDNSPTCTTQIALVGDSFTWGPYVNDADTWVNQLALEYPGACFYNYGMWSYNADQVAQTLDELVPDEMDYVIYLIFQNDDMELIECAKPEHAPRPPRLNLLRYAQIVGWQLGWTDLGWISEPPRNHDLFVNAIAELATDPRVYFMGFEGEKLLSAAREVGVEVYEIPPITADQMIAPIDHHPTADGHRFMAQAMFPLIDQLLAQPDTTALTAP